MYHISISTCFDYSVPIEVQLPMIRQAGYGYVSLSGNYEHNGILEERKLPELAVQLRDHDLSVDTIHGYVMDEPDSIEVNRKIAKAAAKLGAPVVVLHCSSFTFEPSTLNDRKKDILEKIKTLEIIAHDNGIRFALENVLPGFATDFMEETINNSDSKYFGFCYDSSHDQIGGPRSFDLLERLSDRLFAVHISDRIKEFTDHVVPGEGFIDFERLCSLLKQANVKFPLLLEVMTTYSKYKNPKEFLAISYREAVMLYDKIYT